LLVEANRLNMELYEFATKEFYPIFRRRYEGSLERDVAEFKRANESPGRLRPQVNQLANRHISRRILRLKRAVSYYR
jgi:hypothetical protein